ncbi:MAG: hypothetical protein KF774_10075 [Planctomyces sp.]|nr:hypothetical protein [Planctomyces sp.]
MRRTSAGLLPLLLTVCASRPLPAQAPPAASGWTSQSGSSPVAGEPDGTRSPPRIAQYPLENDPYEQPPGSAGTSPWGNPGLTQAPQSPWAAPEEPAWIARDWTQVQGGFIQDSAEGLGWGDVILTSTISFPRAPAVWLGPQFGMHFLGSTEIPNIPPELYDATLEVAFGLPLNDVWTISGAISPGIFSDFSGAGGDEFRIPCRALVFYKWNEVLTLAGGFMYLDRADITALPLVGLSYIPSDTFRAELWFPRPKFSWRYSKRGDIQRWVYLVGELGGGSWAIERDDGQPDTLSYRDYRALAGVEQKCPDGIGWFMEGGLVFGRRVEFDRLGDDYSLQNSATIQLGLRF